MQALEKILQSKVQVDGASRTDRGVHALGQIVCIHVQKESASKNLLNRLNCLLPKSIRVLEARKLIQSFHPTLEAESKTYQYKVNQDVICCPFKRTKSWHVPKRLNSQAMQSAITLIEGEKDFKGLSNISNKNDTIRRIHSIKINQEKTELEFIVKGDKFLYKMVRNIVGSLVYIGLGKLSQEALKNAIKTKNRSLAGPCAPSQGLYLKQVLYTDSIYLLLINSPSC